LRLPQIVADQIVYRFLLSIGIDQRTAAMDAEGIEHHVSPKTLRRLEELAGEGTAP
jgi:DtxR family manganese transport transcriptional regulator